MTAPAEPEFDYEQALLRVRAITEALQAPERPVAESVALYREGQALLAQCQRYLAEVSLSFETAAPDTPA